MFSEFEIRDTRCTFPAIIFCNVRFDIWNVQALLSFVSEGVKTTPPASISVSLASCKGHDDLSRPFNSKTYINTDTMDNLVWAFLSDQQHRKVRCKFFLHLQISSAASPASSLLPFLSFCKDLTYFALLSLYSYLHNLHLLGTILWILL